MTFDITDGILRKVHDCAAHAVIPEGVTSIGKEAFSGCKALQSVSIPASVAFIGSHAFSFCENLQSVSIPDGVTSIKAHTFTGCSNLQSVSIPDSVTSIGVRAFSYCKALNFVSIPSSVTSIGYSAFEHCAFLDSISIPDSVSEIADGTFAFCSFTRSVFLPDTLTSIGANAFSGCFSLESIRIPDSVTSIESGAFFYCRGLKSITLAPHHLSMYALTAALSAAEVIRCIAEPSLLPEKYLLKVCLGFALSCGQYPQEMHESYLRCIRSHADQMLRSAHKYPQILRLLCREGLIDAAAFPSFLNESIRRKDAELTALLLEYKFTHLTDAQDESASLHLEDL